MNKFKIRHIVIMLFIILVLVLGVTTVHSKDENIQSNMSSITTHTKAGEAGILLVFQYEWSDMPLRLSSDVLRIGWSEGWRIEDFSVNINGEDMTYKFANKFDEKYNNELLLKINSNSNFLSKESFKVEVLLVPDNISKISNNIYSAANLQYIHKSLINRVVKSDSIGWKNEKVLLTIN